MSTLHTVNKSPFSTQSLQSCLNHCKDGDAVLMIEDGVYGALTNSNMSKQVQTKAGNVTIYVLSPDADARGLIGDKLLGEVIAVDYAGFVKLVTKHDRTQNWL
ncbi:MAG: sulfurtransferase complex subunit TusB [Paracoccaceae bacterium]|nr:sulfurtransferase complex subunit TusB [Paracoccaceae bacterium]MDG2257997.1 sulfurtransferase complex subunit TusB [Paracoccaceae bacterium]